MMRKIILISAICLVFSAVVSSCTNSKKGQNDNKETNQEYNTPNDSIKRCNTMEVLEKHLAKNPELRSRIEAIEKQCEAFIELRKSGKMQDLDTITIPTVVHVIYSNENENISDAQIQSQIEVLNQDFTKSNTDIDQVPEEFLNLSANTMIHFDLDSIIRVSSTRTEWGTDDQMKFSSNGGSDVVDASKHLNIWVCNIGGGILGYAQFPGDSADTDGIVVSPQFFGTEGYVSPPFNLGRTTTHEVGHWLNLRHIWGDGDCNEDDFVDDTPISDGPNYGCPTYPLVHCNTNDMTMNYMDYTDDNCMYMFTEGQRDRMRAVFAMGGPRESFIKKPIQ